MEMRREQRVPHRAKMRLTPAGGGEAVVVRVENISPRGAFVSGSALPGPGVAVACGFLVGGQPRTIGGRVAWQRPDGAGIEFVEVGEAEAQLLRRIVARRQIASHPMELWFQGQEAAARGHGTVDGPAVKVAAALPFARMQAPVRVALAGQERVGTVESVALAAAADGIPELHLAVAFPAGSAAVTMPPPGEDGAASSALALFAPTPPVPAPPPAPAATRPSLRWLAGWRPSLVGAVVGALIAGALLWRPARRPPPVVREVSPPALVDPPLAVEKVGRVARLALPLLGSSKGLRRRELTHPPGLAFTFPRARPRLAPGVYDAADAPLRVEVRRRGAGAEVWLLFDPRAQRATVAAADGQLTVELAPRD
jgi:hypothetical protein